MNIPKVSIIIPTFNRADLIGDTLYSVLAQTYRNWECIIVDDGSTDETQDLIEKYILKDNRFQYHNRPANKQKGPSSCRNVGVAKAKGDYIIFLDSDDLLTSSCVEHRVRFASEHADYDFWIFKMSAFEGTIDNVKFTYDKIITEDEGAWCLNEFMKGQHPFVVTGPMWKKMVLLAVGGFNEQMTMIEDPELHLRILLKGYKLKYDKISDVDCFYRLTQSKNNLIAERRNNLLMFDLYLEKNNHNMKIYFKKMYNYLAFDNFSFSCFNNFFRMGFSKGVLSYDKFFMGYVLLIYYFFKMNNHNGIGVNYFKTKFNNF